MRNFKDIRESSVDEDVNEGPLVMNDLDVLDTILNKIRDDISRLKLKKQLEKAWPTMKGLAKIAGYGITKNSQQDGKTFRYDLKK